MIKLIRELLQEQIDNIDSGNSNITEDDQLKVIELFKNINDKELTKIEAADYIGKSRATFDNYVKKGLIPKGHHKRGQNTLVWNKQDLYDFLNK